MKNFKEATKKEALAMLILRAAEQKKLKKVVFSKSDDPFILRANATLKRIGKEEKLQCEYFQKDNKAIHKNFSLDGGFLSAIEEIISAFAQVNLITTAGDCEYKRSKSGKEALIGGEKLFFNIEKEGFESIEIIGNDRQKERILDGNEPFLKLLGVSDANGRVYDKKRSKFKQINRFLEMIRDVASYLPKDAINICDLCCGKSYLSFAVYHYFANILGYKVQMRGVDLKSDVITYCNEVADSLGFDGLEFVCADIKNYECGFLPSLVISLHACDTATDIVLDKAVEWSADVILSTPCCHHELNHTLNCPTLSFIAEYSMLRQKLCDAATDALRLKKLESEGYSCDALELIDPDETPKNIMLRAIRKKNFSKNSKEAKQYLCEYENAKAFLLGK